MGFKKKEQEDFSWNCFAFEFANEHTDHWVKKRTSFNETCDSIFVNALIQLVAERCGKCKGTWIPTGQCHVEAILFCLF